MPEIDELRITAATHRPDSQNRAECMRTLRSSSQDKPAASFDGAMPPAHTPHAARRQGRVRRL
eukprot:6181993-Pleurochrysis_carterae.AAC.1